MNIYAKKNLIRRRIEHNYLDFKTSLRGVSRGKLFEMAARIAAVTEAYEFLTGWHDWDEESELDFYLLFRDPLTIITDAWESRRNENACDVEAALMDLSHTTGSTVAEYPLIEGVEDDIEYIGSDE